MHSHRDGGNESRFISNKRKKLDTPKTRSQRDKNNWFV